MAPSYYHRGSQTKATLTHDTALGSLPPSVAVSAIPTPQCLMTSGQTVEWLGALLPDFMEIKLNGAQKTGYKEESTCTRPQTRNYASAGVASQASQKIVTCRQARDQTHSHLMVHS